MGVKRSIITDGRGLPIGIVVAPANRHDSTLMLETIKSIPIRKPKQTKNNLHHLCLDKAYDANWIQAILPSLGFTPHIRQRDFLSRMLKNKKLKGRRHKPKRWVVERSFSWLNRNRSIMIRWEKIPYYYRALLHIAAALLAFKKAGIR